MKVINGKIVFIALVVICVIGFCSVPYLIGACNYPELNYSEIEVDLECGNRGATVGDKRTFSVSFDIKVPRSDFGQGADLMDEIEDIVPSAFNWDYNGSYWTFKEKVYNRLKLEAKTPGQKIVTSVSIRPGVGFFGDCQASYESNIYPVD